MRRLGQALASWPPPPANKEGQRPATQAHNNTDVGRTTRPPPADASRQALSVVGAAATDKTSIGIDLSTKRTTFNRTRHSRSRNKSHLCPRRRMFWDIGIRSRQHTTGGQAGRPNERARESLRRRTAEPASTFPLRNHSEGLGVAARSTGASKSIQIDRGGPP